MATNPTPLEGASVLVAGATGGLGRALVAECLGRGAVVTAVARRPGPLEALGGELAARLAIDLRTPEACQQAVAGAVEAVGRVDVVVNAVGVVAFGPVTELTADTLEELFLTNTFVPVWLAQAALGHLGEGGVLVNLSGVVAERALPGMAAYASSKAAVRAFDEALAREARRVGIRVLDARPPHTETGLADRPIAGAAPRMPEGLAPGAVAAVLCDAIEDGRTDLPTAAFGS